MENILKQTIKNALIVRNNLRSKEAKQNQRYFITGLIVSLRLFRKGI